MNNEKLQDLLRKLKALADKGIGGEKENAEKALCKLADKHGIDLASLDDDKTEWMHFKVQSKYRKLFAQIAGSVTGISSTSYKCAGQDLWIECKKHEAIEIEAKYEFYMKEYEKDLEIFYEAFIRKNDLTVKIKPNPDEKPEGFTKEQLEQNLRVSMMQQGLERKNFHKKLSHNNEK